MSKLSGIEKELFSIAEKTFVKCDVMVVSIKELGLTIGLQSTNDQYKNHMRVYVTQCGMNDTFKFKRGVIALLEKFDMEFYIVIPVLGRSYAEMLNDILHMYAEHTTIQNVTRRYL